MRIPDPKINTDDTLKLVEYFTHFCNTWELNPYNGEIGCSLWSGKLSFKNVEELKEHLENSFVVQTYFKLAKRFIKILEGKDKLNINELIAVWYLTDTEYEHKSDQQFIIDVKSALVRQLINHREIIYTLLNEYSLKNFNKDFYSMNVEKSKYDKEVDIMIQKLLF